LATLVDMNVLDFDVLLTLAPMTVERFDQRRVCPRQLVRLVQILAPTFEGLLSNHCTPITLHGGIMARDQLPKNIPSSSSCGFMPAIAASIALTWRIRSLGSECSRHTATIT
jgi:hypothetical protein